MAQKISSEKLLAVSRLFNYPDEIPNTKYLTRLNMENIEVGDLKTLRKEYRRLFKAAPPDLPCPPYGSDYLDEKDAEKYNAQLKELYADYGVEPEERPDHFAVELEFLSLLQAIASDGPEPDDYDTLLAHVQLWMPAFMESVEKSSELEFYRKLAGKARKLIQE